MFALLDCLREIDENILAHVEADQPGQAGHGTRDLAQLIVCQAQVLQSVAVEQRSEKIHFIYQRRWVGVYCLPRQVTDVVRVKSEDLQGSLVSKNLIGNIVQRAMSVVQLCDLLLLPAQAGETQHTDQAGGQTVRAEQSTYCQHNGASQWDWKTKHWPPGDISIECLLSL